MNTGKEGLVVGWTSSNLVSIIGDNNINEFTGLENKTEESMEIECPLGVPHTSNLHQPCEPPPCRPIRVAAPSKYLRPFDREQQQLVQQKKLNQLKQDAGKCGNPKTNKSHLCSLKSTQSGTKLKAREKDVKKSEQKKHDEIFDRGHPNNKNRDTLEELIRSYEDTDGIPCREVEEEDRIKLKPKLKHWTLRNGQKWSNIKAFGLKQARDDMEVRKRKILNFKDDGIGENRQVKKITNILGRQVAAKPGLLSRWESGYQAIVTKKIGIEPTEAESFVIPYHSSRTFKESNSSSSQPIVGAVAERENLKSSSQNTDYSEVTEPDTLDPLYRKPEREENDETMEQMQAKLVKTKESIAVAEVSGHFNVTLAEGPFGEGSGACSYEEALDYLELLSKAHVNIGEGWSLRHNKLDLLGILPAAVMQQLEFIERNQLLFLMKVSNSILLDKFVWIWHLSVRKVIDEMRGGKGEKVENPMDIRVVINTVWNIFYDHVGNSSVELPSLMLPWKKVPETYLMFEYGEDQQYKTIPSGMIGTAMQKPWKSLYGTNLVMTYCDALGFLPNFKVNAKSYDMLLNKLLIMHAEAANNKRPHQVIEWRDIVRFWKMYSRSLPMNVGFFEKLKQAIAREGDLIFFSVYPVDNQCGFAIATRADKQIRIYVGDQFDGTFRDWESYMFQRTVLIQQLKMLKVLIEDTFNEDSQWCVNKTGDIFSWPWWDTCHRIDVPKSTNTDTSPLLAAYALEKWVARKEWNIERRIDEDDDNIAIRLEYIKILKDTALQYNE